MKQTIPNINIDSILSLQLEMELLKMEGENKGGGKPITKTKNLLLNMLESCSHIPKDEKLILRKYLQALQEIGENNKVVNILSAKMLNKKQEITLRKQAEKIRKDFQSNMITPLNNMSSQNCIQPSEKANLKFKSTSVTKIKSLISTFHFVSRPNERFQYLTKKKSNKSVLKQKSQQIPVSKKNSVIEKQANKKSLQSGQRNKSKDQGQSKDRRIKIWLKCKNKTNPSCRVHTDSSNSIRTRKFDEQQVVQNDNDYKQFKGNKSFLKTQSLSCLFSKKKHKFLNLPFAVNSSMQQKEAPENITDKNAFKIYNFKSEQSLSNKSEQEKDIDQSTLKLPFSIRNVYKFKHKGSIDGQSFNSTFLRQKQGMTAEDLMDVVKSQRNLNPHQFQISKRQLDQIISVYTDWSNLNIKSLSNKKKIKFEDLVAFLEDNDQLMPKNRVRQLFSKMQRKISSSSSTEIRMKRISGLQFKSAFSNSSQRLHEKFEELIKVANRETNSISYWQFYWLKDTEQFQKFEKIFSQVN